MPDLAVGPEEPPRTTTRCWRPCIPTGIVTRAAWAVRRCIPDVASIHIPEEMTGAFAGSWPGPARRSGGCAWNWPRAKSVNSSQWAGTQPAA